MRLYAAYSHDLIPRMDLRGKYYYEHCFTPMCGSMRQLSVCKIQKKTILFNGIEIINLELRRVNKIKNYNRLIIANMRHDVSVKHKNRLFYGIDFDYIHGSGLTWEKVYGYALLLMFHPGKKLQVVDIVNDSYYSYYSHISCLEYSARDMFIYELSEYHRENFVSQCEEYR